MRLKLTCEARGQRAGEERLGQAGHAFEDDMAAGEQRDERFLDQRFLADDDFFDFLPDFGSAELRESRVHAMADLISIRSLATRSQPEGGRPSI